MANDDLPDIRDGLTRKQRVVLHVLHTIQQERGEGNVPTPLLLGRVCEYFSYRSRRAVEDARGFRSTTVLTCYCIRSRRALA